MRINMSCSVADLLKAAERQEQGRAMAIRRLQHAVDVATQSDKLDLEEIDHLNKIMQMLRDSAGPIHWADILDFQGGSA